MTLTKTFAAIKKEFPGADNNGLRDALRKRAVSIADARKQGAEHDLTFVARSIGFTALGQAKLNAINAVFLAEIN